MFTTQFLAQLVFQIICFPLLLIEAQLIQYKMTYFCLKKNLNERNWLKLIELNSFM